MADQHTSSACPLNDQSFVNELHRLVRSKRWFGGQFSTLVLISVAFTAAATAAEKTVIEPLEKWSNVFAGTETKWTYRFATEQPPKNIAAWRLTMNQRLLASGELDFNEKARKLVDRTIALRWPKVEDNRVVSADLTVTAGDASHVRTVWLFPKDAFADRGKWLKELKLKLFDPEGRTIDKFAAAEIPFEQLGTIESMDDVEHGIVIVGEGCSLKQFDDLFEELRKMAARGIPVLCLASSNGEFSFPGERPGLVSVQLKNANVIRQLDKRLDTSLWSKGPSQANGFLVRSDSDEVASVVVAGQKGWPWCEWRFESETGKRANLIWCGFGIIRSWDDGPTARFLLASVLERLWRSTELAETIDNEHRN